jgi:hypothetical protein
MGPKRIPSTNPVLIDDPLAANFSPCEKIRSIVKKRCTWVSSYGRKVGYPRLSFVPVKTFR